jgi:hypothetical protein
MGKLHPSVELTLGSSGIDGIHADDPNGLSFVRKCRAESFTEAAQVLRAGVVIPLVSHASRLH